MSNKIHYDLSVRDFVMSKKQKRQRWTRRLKLGKLTFRLWGYEQYINYNVRFLHLYDSAATPLRSNKTNATMIYVISGYLLFNGLNRHRMAECGDVIIVDKGVFYSLGAAMGDAQVLELQNKELDFRKLEAAVAEALEIIVKPTKKGEAAMKKYGLQNPPL